MENPRKEIWALVLEMSVGVANMKLTLYEDLCYRSYKRYKCNIPIHQYVKCTSNVHNSYIDNIGIPKHEKHLRLLSSGTKLFITFELKVI